MDNEFFEQIKRFAGKSNAPVDKERGIIREFLQSKFISILYEFPESNKLSFVGGTSLRLLRGIPRFSEDLDFDNLGLGSDTVEEIVKRVVKRFNNENIETELKVSIKERKTYFELRFPHLLHRFKISTNPRENLMIKVDYSDFWRGQTAEAILFSAYGFITTVPTNTLNQILVQKLTAYVRRPRTQPRDLYDIVWLYSQGARLDLVFMKKNGLNDVLDEAREKFAIEGVDRKLKARLIPFLFKSEEVLKLDLTGDVLNHLLLN